MDVTELSVGFANAKLCLQFSHNFSLLDGVDPEVCFQFIIKCEIRHGVACFF